MAANTASELDARLRRVEGMLADVVAGFFGLGSGAPVNAGGARVRAQQAAARIIAEREIPPVETRAA